MRFEAGPDATEDVDAGSIADADAAQKEGSAGMVEITAASGARFAIDATEVTVGRFLAFRATQDAGGSFPECPSKHSLGPKTDTGCQVTTNAQQPITCVDWCDAKAYCASVGKRLCGRIGGGALERGTESNPLFDEWSRACGGPDATKWPYGAQAAPLACITSEGMKSAPVPVATVPACVGGEPLLFDMSGNVEEWEDACVAAEGGTPRKCLVRGGSFEHPASESTCTYVLLATGEAPLSDVGIRCCKDL